MRVDTAARTANEVFEFGPIEKCPSTFCPIAWPVQDPLLDISGVAMCDPETGNAVYWRVVAGVTGYRLVPIGVAPARNKCG